MCGIFAYIGCNPEVLQYLIQGLQRLEYRGYDSAGVCIHAEKPQSDGVHMIAAKSAGKVANLNSLTADAERYKGSCGIAHTRWATHGKNKKSVVTPS